MDGESQEAIAQCHQWEDENSYWFQEYTQYIMHYAKLAERVSCDMLVIGCELVELEQKETYWRTLICNIRDVYSGFFTYNANCCTEANVMWWDALDYISANGFYPNNELSKQIDRIYAIQKKYNINKYGKNNNKKSSRTSMDSMNKFTKFCLIFISNTFYY